MAGKHNPALGMARAKARLAGDRQRFLNAQGRQRDRQPSSQRGKPQPPKRDRLPEHTKPGDIQHAVEVSGG
jgi:hypothetical protein